MRLRLCRITVFCTWMLMLSCSIGTDSIPGGGGGGGGGPAVVHEPRRGSVFGVSTPLNFQLRFDIDPKEVPTVTVSERRAREFLSIGISEFARDYAVASSDWTVQFVDDSGLHGRSTTADRVVVVKLTSPVSPEFEAAAATPMARKLLASDPEIGSPRVYRVSFRPTVEAVVRPETPNVIDFKVDLNVLLESKHPYAAEKRFSFVTHNQNRLLEWGEHVSAQLVASYVNALNAAGLKVTARRRQ